MSRWTENVLPWLFHCNTSPYEAQLDTLSECLFLIISKLEFPLPKEALCLVNLKLCQWFWRIRKCKKVYRQTDGQKQHKHKQEMFRKHICPRVAKFIFSVEEKPVRSK